MDIDEWHALLWDPDQDAFQYLTVAELLAANRAAFMDARRPQFVVLGLVATRPQAEELLRNYAPTRDARQKKGAGED